MALHKSVALWLRPVFYLGHNALTLVGVVLTTSSAFTLISFWALEILKGGPVHAYTGIIFFLILPGVFMVGLVLMPLGALWRRAKVRALGQLPETYPQIDFRSSLLRRALPLVAFATFLNFVILVVATSRGVSYMDSVQFCGEACHTVMAPEYAAYQDSPHSRVACAECHIGPGAPWFVRAKISGIWQIFAITFNTYSRPIPSPVEELRPARETCEQCHWPQKFHGDKFLVRTKYAEDETNTPLTTVLVLKLGGRNWQGSTGIHGRHLDTFERISYLAIDDRRQVIHQVNYIDDEDETVEYVSTEIEATPEQLVGGERRLMDCMDCHNRPTHAFQLPERAVDEAISEGRISPQLPYIKKKAVEVLRAEYPDRPSATQRIASALTDFYRVNHPDIYRGHRALVETAVQQVQTIYLRNVFPEMNVDWGTYPDNIGHEDFLGCFRCHDGSHESADGRVISQDCDTCHNILAWEEPEPKILEELGLK